MSPATPKFKVSTDSPVQSTSSYEVTVYYDDNRQTIEDVVIKIGKETQSAQEDLAVNVYTGFFTDDPNPSSVDQLNAYVENGKASKLCEIFDRNNTLLALNFGNITVPTALKANLLVWVYVGGLQQSLEKSYIGEYALANTQFRIDFSSQADPKALLVGSIDKPTLPTVPGNRAMIVPSVVMPGKYMLVEASMAGSSARKVYAIVQRPTEPVRGDPIGIPYVVEATKENNKFVARNIHSAVQESSNATDCDNLLIMWEYMGGSTWITHRRYFFGQIMPT